MKKEAIEIGYKPDNEEIVAGYDLTGDGQPDITIRVKVGAIIRTHWKGAIATAIIIGLGAAHAMGWL